eukprot:m.353126 g.353126  ORF g.353126 m.353126 type:complete len:234 (+) comp16686_c0_seq1:163-864(+)
MAARTALVVGASRGIGQALAAKMLTPEGGAYSTVFKTVRKGSAEDEQADDVFTGVDVTDIGALRSTAAALQARGVELDTLVVVSGILNRESLDDMKASDQDFATVKQQLEVNTLGPLMTVMAFLPVMKKPGKVALLTSRMGSIADNGSGNYYGYRASKAGLNAIGVSLANDLKAEEISVGLLHPGMVKTEMTGFRGIEIAESVAGLVTTIEERLTLDTTGTFWHAVTGEVLPW